MNFILVYQQDYDSEARLNSKSFFHTYSFDWFVKIKTDVMSIFLTSDVNFFYDLRS